MAKCREHWRIRRAKAGAAERWRRDRERRTRLAGLSPLRHPGMIVRRIIVIDHETTAREVVFYDTDSQREARRKWRAVCAVTATAS